MDENIVNRRDWYYILLSSLLIFIVLLPISKSINYMQNDDWVYYKQVERFSEGNFSLDQYIQATFYTQGLLAMVFSKVFGLSKIPVLTLIISVLNYFLFTYITRRFFLKSLFDSIVVGMVFFLSPLHIYGLLGFMTDNYFVFYSLFAIFMAQIFLFNRKILYFILFNLCVFIGFFGRQLVVIFPVALAVTLLTKKMWRYATLQTILLVLLLYIYFKVFPTTGEMQGNHIVNTEKIKNLPQLFSNIYAYLFYGIAFILPIPFASLSSIKTLNKMLITISLSLSCFLAIQTFYAPSKDLHSEMYYIGNTVTRNGFFAGTHLRAKNKYHIKYERLIYTTWGLLTKIALSISLAVSVVNYKKLLNFYTLSLIIYTVTMLILKVVYDRYLTIMAVLSIFILLSNLAGKVLPIPIKFWSFLFLILMCLYSYNFGMEFLIINNSMWKKANNLVKIHGVKKEKISAGYAWNRLNKNPKADYRYIFTFGTKNQNPDLSSYEIIDTIDIKYPLNIFENSKVYLYKRPF